MNLWLNLQMVLQDMQEAEQLIQSGQLAFRVSFGAVLFQQSSAHLACRATDTYY